MLKSIVLHTIYWLLCYLQKIFSCIKFELSFLQHQVQILFATLLTQVLFPHCDLNLSVAVVYLLLNLEVVFLLPVMYISKPQITERF